MITTTTQGIYAGVCLSTARPTTPYLGQVIFETDTNKMKVWLGSVWSDGYTHVYTPPGDFYSIATTTVGASGQTTITFSDIPQTFKHLQLRIMNRDAFSSTLNNLYARFNGDTGSNYSVHGLLGNGSTAFSEGYANQTSMVFGLPSGNNAAANIFGVSIVDILDYTNTNKYKTARALMGNDQNGSGSIRLWSNNWRSSSAVSSISLYSSSSPNTTQYSSFALYGIKG